MGATNELRTLSISGPSVLLDAIFADREVARAELNLQIAREDLETRSVKEKLMTTLIVIGTAADLISIGSFIASKIDSAPKQAEIVVVNEDNSIQVVLVDTDNRPEDFADDISSAVSEATRK